MSTSFVLTYDNLISIVPQYLERSDVALISAIPNFITLCEFEIATQIKTLGQMQVQTTAFQAGQPVMNKPARWRKTVSMAFVDDAGQRQPILLRKYEYLKSYWPSVTATDLPKYYSDYDYDHWFFAPTPSKAFALEVLYYERMQPLSSTNQTNWLTINAPNLLLYGTLLQAMPFLKDDKRTVFEEKYKESLEALKTEDILRIGDRQAVAQDS